MSNCVKSESITSIALNMDILWNKYLKVAMPLVDNSNLARYMMNSVQTGG